MKDEILFENLEYSAYDILHGNEEINEGVKYFKNSKRLVKLATKIRKRASIAEKKGYANEAKEAMKFSDLVLEVSKEFANIEDEFKTRRKIADKAGAKAVKTQFKQLEKKYLFLVREINKETTVNALKVVGVIAIVGTTLFFSYQALFQAGHVTAFMGKVSAGLGAKLPTGSVEGTKESIKAIADKTVYGGNLSKTKELLDKGTNLSRNAAGSAMQGKMAKEAFVNSNALVDLYSGNYSGFDTAMKAATTGSAISKAKGATFAAMAKETSTELASVNSAIVKQHINVAGASAGAGLGLVAIFKAFRNIFSIKKRREARDEAYVQTKLAFEKLQKRDNKIEAKAIKKEEKAKAKEITESFMDNMRKNAGILL